jgi:hypothetical protein
LFAKAYSKAWKGLVLASSDEVKLAVITQPLSEFNTHPEYKNLILEDEDCRQFVEDVRDLKQTGGPAWFLQHLPRTYWSELEENIKARVYQSGFRQPLIKLMQFFAIMLVGAGLLATTLYFAPPSKEQVTSQFDLSHYFQKIDSLLLQSQEHTINYNPFNSTLDQSWVAVSMNIIGESENEKIDRQPRPSKWQQIVQNFKTAFD